MSDLNGPVAYLEDVDFDMNGNFTPKLRDDTGKYKVIDVNKPVVIMIQASWCGYCTKSKPAFQEFANRMNGKVLAATIQSDEQENLMKKIKKIDPNFQGFPSYVLYKNGKRVDKEINGRDVNSLIEFCRI